MKWQKLQTAKGSQKYKEELLKRAPDSREGMTIEYLQAVGSFYVVTELPQQERMGDVWYTCSCGDAEHDAMCVHIVAAGLQYHSEAYSKLMPAKARQNVSLQEKPKAGRPRSIEPVRSFWG